MYFTDSCWGSFPFCYLTVCHPSLLIVLSLVGAASQAVCSTNNCWGTVFFFHLTVCPLVEQPSMSVDCTVICGAASPVCLYFTVICGAASLLPLFIFHCHLLGQHSHLCLFHCHLLGQFFFSTSLLVLLGQLSLFILLLFVGAAFPVCFTMDC